jgi:enoyl-CoA hydratase/carnithine racemase
MTGDFIPAARAGEIGLYHRVVPDGQAVAAARELAEKLARGPGAAVAVTKDMLNREASMSLEAALIAEARVQATRMEDPNFREAHRAFTEKRAPRFE